jgi:hypothetical protein
MLRRVRRTLTFSPPKELERENATLKRLLADPLVENEALRELNRGNW